MERSCHLQCSNRSLVEHGLRWLIGKVLMLGVLLILTIHLIVTELLHGVVELKCTRTNVGSGSNLRNHIQYLAGLEEDVLALLLTRHCQVLGVLLRCVAAE